MLISGRGSNLAALIQACKASDYPAEIALVISNRPEAPGLHFAAERRYPDARSSTTSVLPAAADLTPRSMRRCASSGVDLVCNAGFMRLLTPDFVESWRDRHLNIHPSLLPAFRGLETHERAIDAGVRISGCTVHFVRAQMDDGPIIAQAGVPVLPDDDADTLAARVLRAEHRLYPWAVRLVASGGVKVADERVIYGPGISRNRRTRALFVPPPPD